MHIGKPTTDTPNEKRTTDNGKPVNGVFGLALSVVGLKFYIGFVPASA
jgi:hypothetical protein